MIKISVTCPICRVTQHMDSKITIFGIDISRFVKYTGNIIKQENK
jgi:hypothetical protein